MDRTTLATNFPGVYAVGDITGIPLAIGKPLPKAGVLAHGQAEVVARNIAAEIQGERARAAFTGHGACFIEIGDGRAGYSSGNFYAEPAPRIALRPPGRLPHLGKVIYEKILVGKQILSMPRALIILHASPDTPDCRALTLHCGWRAPCSPRARTCGCFWLSTARNWPIPSSAPITRAARCSTKLLDVGLNVQVCGGTMKKLGWDQTYTLPGIHRSSMKGLSSFVSESDEIVTF